MRITDYITEALDALRVAKLRTFLTSLGIVIGVFAVALMLSIGEGVTRQVTSTFADLGATRITIVPGTPTEPGARGGAFGAPVASMLTVADAEALAGLEGVVAVSPVLSVPATITGPAAARPLAVTGAGPDYWRVTDEEILQGRPLAAGAGEVVLNETAADLFFEGAALDQSIQVNGQTLTVVGVAADSPLAAAQFGPDAPAQPVVVVPIQVALDLASAENVGQIVLAAGSPEQVDAVVESSRDLLVERHGGVQAFRVISIQGLLDAFTRIFDVLTVGLAAIAGISLLVGGIGIMNIMLASVTERTREIGIAKAIGATRVNIVAQFLVEAMLLSLLGGALGLLLAAIGAAVLRQTLDVPAVISLTAVGLAVGVSAAIGLIFGVMPAWRATRLDPIVALRHE